jgi:hypothetical protein
MHGSRAGQLPRLRGAAGLLAALALLVGAAARATAAEPQDTPQDPVDTTSQEPVPASAAVASVDPFARGTTTLEFGVAGLDESWNFNEAREWQIEGDVTAWYAVARGLAVGVAWHNSRVFQSTGDPYVSGVFPLLVRWRLLERRSWRLVQELGGGLSWSTRDVPPRGTRFNFLFQSSLGLQQRIGQDRHVVAAIRFLHLSNADRVGPTRNPDLQMLGVYTGVSVSFRPRRP